MRYSLERTKTARR